MDKTHSNDFQNQINNDKIKLMEKFNLSADEAEKIIRNLEDKQQEELNNSINSKNYENQSIESNLNPQNSGIRTDDQISFYQNLDNQNNNISNIEKIKTPEEKNDLKPIIEENMPESPVKNSIDEKVDVDTIISDIIPDYNQHVSIEVNHLDLTFEVSNEKVDTLKETFIRTLKRNKSKKMKIHALKKLEL